MVSKKRKSKPTQFEPCAIAGDDHDRSVYMIQYAPRIYHDNINIPALLYSIRRKCFTRFFFCFVAKTATTNIGIINSFALTLTVYLAYTFETKSNDIHQHTHTQIAAHTKIIRWSVNLTIFVINTPATGTQYQFCVGFLGVCNLPQRLKSEFKRF